MSAELVGSKRRWAASAAGALVVMVTILALMRVTSSPPRLTVPAPELRPAPKALVEIASPGRADKMLDDEKVMQDQRPLFLPTERNVTLRPPRRPEAGRTVLDQDSKRFSFGEAELKLSLPAPEQISEKPTEVMLTDSAAMPLHGFGRRNAEITPLEARGAFVEILTTGTNRRVLAETLAVEAKPPTDRPWRPLEFIARIDAAGLVGPLVISERSDVEEVDSYFRNYLVRTFRIGERLPPGFYRIVVGP